MSFKYFYILLMSFCLGSCSNSSRSNPPFISYDKELNAKIICDVFQHSGMDSTNTKITKVIQYLDKNVLLQETFKNHYLYSGDTYSLNKEIYYDYKGDLLVQMRTVTRKGNRDFLAEDSTKVIPPGDSIKVVYHYNSNDVLIKETHYTFEKRIKKESYGKGILGDYENERSWDVVRIIHFKYDSLGRKIESYLPKDSLQNRYTTKYNNKGEILEKGSYYDDRIIWTAFFDYSEQRYSYKRIWYDDSGKSIHLKPKNALSWPLYIFEYRLDSLGRETEELVSYDNGILFSRKITEYNEEGLISRTVVFSNKNIPEITHTYKYQKK